MLVKGESTMTGASYILDLKSLDRFCEYLLAKERSPLTVEKYRRDILAFYKFLPCGKEVDRDTVLAYKQQLRETHRLSSANSMLAALNSLFSYLGWLDCRVASYKCQRRMFCPEERELSREEYLRLVRTARRQGNHRLDLVMQTLCSCGLRVGELCCVTVEGARRGSFEAVSKGKSRIVFLQEKLAKELLCYARRRGIVSGPVFVTSTGRPLDRSNVWREMKRLCFRAGVNAAKVFPHNLRHLFARMFYSLEKDLVKLADLLGHSSVNTTRIYTVSSGAEHKKQLSAMRLLL